MTLAAFLQLSCAFQLLLNEHLCDGGCAINQGLGVRKLASVRKFQRLWPGRGVARAASGGCWDFQKDWEPTWRGLWQKEESGPPGALDLGHQAPHGLTTPQILLRKSSLGVISPSEKEAGGGPPSAPPPEGAEKSVRQHRPPTREEK